MREVERARFVDGSPAELERHLSPATILEHEGTFTVDATEETTDGTRVTASGGGMEAVFVFEPLEAGYEYRQVGQQGPFEAMTTTLSYAPRDHGCDVTVRSSVSLGLPLSVVSDRIAAWKRRGELDRLLDGIADATG